MAQALSNNDSNDNKEILEKPEYFESNEYLNIISKKQ